MKNISQILNYTKSNWAFYNPKYRVFNNLKQCSEVYLLELIYRTAGSVDDKLKCVGDYLYTSKKAMINKLHELNMNDDDIITAFFNLLEQLEQQGDISDEHVNEYLTRKPQRGKKLNF